VAEPRETNARVFTILDEIRSDLSALKTDVAVLAAAQPRLVDIVEDHEKRIREIEINKAPAAAVSDLAKRVDGIESTQDKAQWLKNVGLIAGTAAVTGFIAWVLPMLLPHA